MANDNETSLTGEPIENKSTVTNQTDDGASAITGDTQAPSTPTAENPTTPTSTITSNVTPTTPDPSAQPQATIPTQPTGVTAIGDQTTPTTQPKATSPSGGASALTVPTVPVQTTKETKTTSSLVDPELQKNMDEIFEKQRAQFLEKTIAQSQSVTDAFSQKLAQQGYGGTGVQNALLALQYASSDTKRTQGLQQLALAQLEKNFQLEYDEYTFQRDQQLEDLSQVRLANQAIFDSLEGNPAEQVKFAQMMAGLDPDNQFWKQFQDPEFSANWSKWNKVENLERNAMMKGYANNLIAENYQTLNTPNGLTSKFGEWKDIMYDDPQLLGYNSSGWYETASLEDINRELEYLGKPTVNDKSEIVDYKTINDIYAMKEYRKAIKEQTSIQIVDNAKMIMSNMGETLDEQELAFLNTYSNEIMNALGDDVITMGGVTGTFDQLLRDENFAYMAFDWDGKPYTADYNAETIMQKAMDGDVEALYNQRMDALWRSYLKNKSNDSETMTREEFKNLPEINSFATNDYSDKIMTDSLADKAIKGALEVDGFLSQRSISTDFPNLPPEYGRLLAGDNAEQYNAISAMNPNQLASFVNSEAGAKILQKLGSSGQIPTVAGTGSRVNFENQVMQKPDGTHYISPIVMLPDGTILYSDSIANMVPKGKSTIEYIPIGGEMVNQDPYKMKLDVDDYNRIRKVVNKMNEDNLSMDDAIDSVKRDEFDNEDWG